MSISVQGVTRFYGEQKALDNVSFEIRTGEIAGFLGPNGAGKSTMMKIITGTLPASSGNVSINGLDIRSSSMEVRRQTGYLPENNPLYPEMYVREYLGFVASIYKTGEPTGRQVDKMIELTGLGPEQKKKIGSLSKGYRQRVGLAQALIHNPGVLILDEPTTGLDPNQIIEIRNLIRETGKEKTVMLSTHIMQEVEAICERIIIIDKGKIVANEGKDKIFSFLKKPAQVVKVEFDKDPEPDQLKDLGFICTVSRAGKKIYLVESEIAEDIRPLIFRFAVKNGLAVLSLQKQESNIEEVFRHLTT